MSRKFDINKFIKDVLTDKYMLVIGPEIIVDTNLEPTGDIHQYLLRKVNEEHGNLWSHYHEIALRFNEEYNPIRELIQNGSIKLNHSILSKELKELFDKKVFYNIITTTTDDCLESYLRELWGDQLVVVNIFDKATVDSFRKTLQNYRKNQEYKAPTLIYAFGKMDIENWSKPYLRTEDDAIIGIKKWMEMDFEKNHELIQFIRSKRLLALGCKYDDWYFRFFWYVLTGKLDVDFDSTGEVAFSLNKEDRAENHLKQFLDRKNICILDEARDFIDKLTKTLTEKASDGDFLELIKNARKNEGNSIFISYNGKDALFASQLFFRLIENKYDVWLDSARLYGGDDYEKEIVEAIGKAKIFIPLLTPTVAEDLKNGETDHYYNKEWRIAQQLKDKVIIPLAMNGYNLRDEYHQVFETIVRHNTSGIDITDSSENRITNPTFEEIDLMDADGFHKLVLSIEKYL